MTDAERRKSSNENMANGEAKIADEVVDPEGVCFSCQDWNVDGVKKKDIVWIACSTCDKWWHVSSAGLAGLTQVTVGKLRNWNCHFCFVLSDRLKSASLTNGVAKELTAVIQDAVKVSVVDSIQSVLVNTVVDKANQEITKSWAQIASGDQQKLVKDVVQATTGHALSASMQQIDANMQACMKRAKNITIKNLPDNGKEAESMDELKQLICDHAGEISIGEIASARRIGAFNNVNRNKFRGRVVIAILKSEDKAAAMHHYGNGYVYQGASRKEDVWVNPDLIKADRDAKWMAREKKKVEAEKKKDKENAKKEKPVVVPKAVIPKPVYKKATVVNTPAEVNANNEQLELLEDNIVSIEEKMVPVDKNIKSENEAAENDKGDKVDKLDGSDKDSKNE